MRPRLLDLYCGAGGAARGYQLAGFHVTGVDIVHQPRYAGDVFVQGDALEYAAAHGHEYDAIHASPPCQAYSWSTKKMRNLGKVYADLLEPTRKLLTAIGLPYVIENVVGAPMSNPIVLCGTHFGLKVFRHRLFESDCYLMSAGGACSHAGCEIGFDEDSFVTVAGHGADGSGRFDLWQAAMGIDWMTRVEMTQAIPPAFSEFIGRQLIVYVRECV